MYIIHSACTCVAQNPVELITTLSVIYTVISGEGEGERGRGRGVHLMRIMKYSLCSVHSVNAHSPEDGQHRLTEISRHLLNLNSSLQPV